MNGVDFIAPKAMPRAERAHAGTLAGEDPTAGKGAQEDFMKLLQEIPGRLGGNEQRRPSGAAKAEDQAGEPEEAGAAKEGAGEDGDISATDILALAAAAGSAEGARASGEGRQGAGSERHADIRLPEAGKAAAEGKTGEADADAEEERMSRSPLRFTVTDRKTHFAPALEAGRLAAQQAQSAQGAAEGGKAAQVSGEADANVEGLRQALAGEPGADAPARGEGGNRSAAVRAADTLQANAAGNGAGENSGAGGGEAGGREREAGREAGTARSAADRNVAEARLADAGAARGAPVSGTGESALPSSQLGRIASAIASEAQSAGDTQATQRSLPASTASNASTANAGPVKTLTIQLHPVELGSVKIELRLGRDALSVRLEASRAETARMLQQDSQALSDLLKGTGQDGDKIVVHSVTVDRAASGADSAQLFSARPGAQAQADAGAGTAGNGERQSSARQEQGQGQRYTGQEARDGNVSPDGRARSGLFV